MALLALLCNFFPWRELSLGREDGGDDVLGWQTHCHVHCDTQPAPSPLTSDLPVKEGRCFADTVPTVQHTQVHPGTGVSAQISTSAAPTLPAAASLLPAALLAGFVLWSLLPSFHRPTGPLRWEIRDLETRE